VRVRSPKTTALRRALSAWEVERTGPDEIEVTGLAPAEIGDRACSLGIPVHHLAEVEHSLEDAYLRLTEDQVEFHGHAPQRERSEVRS
jgi:ABC-2 type transport system ATP-binding protein